MPNDDVNIKPVALEKGHSNFGKKHLIIGIVKLYGASLKRGPFFAQLKKVFLLVVIIVGVSLGVVLNRGDDSSETLPNRLAEFPVILISADGLRAEYLSRGLTPNITKLGNDGVRANFMLSQFPTKTFPNHYSIVTGLYPESHGIVFNRFYDPDLKKKFSIPKSRNPIFWQKGEPMWITAKKNGMKAASYYWVGSEVEDDYVDVSNDFIALQTCLSHNRVFELDETTTVVHPLSTTVVQPFISWRSRVYKLCLRPAYYRVYDADVPFPDRVQQVLEWLKLPRQERPSFITLYFHQPDYNGHGYGPNSNAVKEQLILVDNMIGLLLAGLDEMNMTNAVNVILVSDHGMSAVNCNRTIFLDKYGVLENKLFVSNLGPVATFNTKHKTDRQKTLDKIKCVNSNFQAFYKKNLPKRMHFSNNRRIDDTIVIAEPGELIVINETRARITPRSYCELGAHGYDNIITDMRAIFLARGPLFKKGEVVDHFSNVEIYNLLAALLKIKPAPNNGTIGSLNRLLVPEAMSPIPQSKGDGNNFRTDICLFPNHEIFAARSSCCTCNCDVSVRHVPQLNKEFNVTLEQGQAYQKLHLPWGLPEGGAGVEGCLMTQPQFIIGYSIHLRIPLWTANRVNGSLSSLRTKRKDCFRPDVRLMPNQTANCASYLRSGFDRGHVVPNGDLDYDNTTALSTFTFANIVPQHPRFNRGIWRRLEDVVRDWALKYKAVHVISGSIFDMDEDGIKDDDKISKPRTHNKPENPAIPTHFYKIITRCDSNTTNEYNVTDCKGSLRVISFILRNTNETCSIYKWEKILTQNVARVKDIELLTGVNFFPELPRQLQVEMKTFLPVELWPR